MNFQCEYVETCVPLNIYQPAPIAINSPGPEWRAISVNVVMQESVAYPGATMPPPVPYRHIVWEKITSEE